MCIDGEICSYVRRCKDKSFAIDMAATIFGRSREQVISALQSYGLMDENENYIEPVRLTGMEVEMGKRKINYPSFQWSPKRQKTLAELYQAGAAVPDIAAHFETDEETVYKAINKYNLVRITHKPVAGAAVPVSPDDTPPAANIPTNVYIDRPLPAIHAPLKDLLHYVVDAANHNNDIASAFFECNEDHAIFELGKQCVKLQEAEKIIKNLLNTFPEP